VGIDGTRAYGVMLTGWLAVVPSKSPNTCVKLGKRDFWSFVLEHNLDLYCNTTQRLHCPSVSKT
jgi:hypothetical protein